MYGFANLNYFSRKTYPQLIDSLTKAAYSGQPERSPTHCYTRDCPRHTLLPWIPADE
jgi:hypothetical protein